jgi:tRNA(Ile)-lysidine synthase
VANLARTARLVAEDTAVLDGLAVSALSAARADPSADNGGRLAVPELVGLPVAVRTRVLHRWALGLGVPPAALSARHVAALDALLTDWHGQGPVHLPGAITVARRGDTLGRG